MKSSIRRSCSLLASAAFVICSFGAAAPGAAAPAKRVVVAPANPHLHVSGAGAQVTIVPGGRGPQALGALPGNVHILRPPVELTHQSWKPRLDTHTFIAEHRGLATIRGVAHTVTGLPEKGVRVALRKARGGVFANVALRHITFTGSNGEFVMNNVRPGTYRVFASIGKRKTFVKEVVKANAVDHVTIKI
jgi:hypothetical protein